MSMGINAPSPNGVADLFGRSAAVKATKLYPSIERLREMPSAKIPRRASIDPNDPEERGNPFTSVTAGPGVSSATGTSPMLGFPAGVGGMVGTIELEVSAVGCASVTVSTVGSVTKSFDVTVPPGRSATDGRSWPLVLATSNWPIASQTTTVTKYDAAGATTTAGSAQVSGSCSVVTFAGP